MDNDFYDAYEDDGPAIDEPICIECCYPMEWELCGVCDGDGIVDHEPDNEEPWGGYENCYECGGSGGGWYCYRHVASALSNTTGEL